MPTTTTANDLRRTHPDLYRAPDTPVRITVPPLTYLMVDGAGDPRGAPAYADAVAALYAVSYGLRFMVKKAGGEPWTVMPLEGLWWAPDMAGLPLDHREAWLWPMPRPPPPPAPPAHRARADGARRRRRGRDGGLGDEHRPQPVLPVVHREAGHVRCPPQAFERHHGPRLAAGLLHHEPQAVADGVERRDGVRVGRGGPRVPGAVDHQVRQCWDRQPDLGVRSAVELGMRPPQVVAHGRPQPTGAIGTHTSVT